ncbi:MAG: hypothetical protein ACJ77A_15620 [Actinomycetota bacterium]
MRRILPVLYALFALAGCARQGSNAVGDPGGTRPAFDSGIRGIAVAGPQCPVERAGSPCPDKPIAAQIDVEAPNGDVVTHVRSDAHGRFEVALQPGRYTLAPRPPSDSGFPYGKPLDVVVRSHRFTRVTVTYDTGIR